MQRQGNKSPRNKPGLRLNLVLLKLVFKWYAETWFKLGLTKPSLNKLCLSIQSLELFMIEKNLNYASNK